MNQPNQTLDVREYISRHLVDVFETMLSKKAQLSDGPEIKLPPERICGSVGFAGETVTGVVYLQFSSAFALKAASAMLGLALEEITIEDSNDAVGEMTNMLAGGLKSELCNANNHCAVSTPSIIRGTNFEVEVVPEVDRIPLSFICENEPVLTEVHIKYT